MDFGVYIGVIEGLYRDNGKENGNYYNGVVQGLEFWGGRGGLGF